MIKSCSGWILDICIENDEAISWIKKEDGSAIRLVDEYDPTLYILPRSETDGVELFQILSDLSIVKQVKWEYKFTDISIDDKKKLLLVTTFSIFHYNQLLKILENRILKERIGQLFNARISHLQKYLFTQVKIQPASKVCVEYEGLSLISIARINDEQEIDLPFSTIHVDIIPSTEQTTSFDYDDPVKSIKVQYQFRTLNFEDNESAILQNFCNYVVSQDPDIIIFSYSDLEVLPYLFERVKRLSLDVQLGRRKIDLYNKHSGNILEKWIQGRIYVPASYQNNESIAGLIELSRFSLLPMRACLKYGVGRLIDSRNCYELLKKNYVFAENYESGEPVRPLAEIVDKDKGGMIISPRVGLHENVAVLDFDDEFANIIVNSNIGYEASDNPSEPKILPLIVKHLIQRRVYFKQLVAQLPQDSIEANLCKERADIIKRILVCLYGTTGSFWNKFGSIQAFEEINRVAREILLKTKDITQELGYELIYADTDAAFVHKSNATRAEYDKLKETLSSKIGMSISLEYHYKFLVLLPLEADEKLEALKHYFGMTYDGELVTRGIETRRHDTPTFIKEFQVELLHTLFHCDNSDDIVENTIDEALLCVTRTIDKVMTGELKFEDLIVSKQLRMNITKYRNLFPHVAAAIQSMNQNKKKPVRGETIQYIHTDSQHQNPLNRVITIGLPDVDYSSLQYDRGKYKEMLLDAAETVLGIFGFDRTVYGKPRNKEWWQELRKSMKRDIEAEASV
jgi:DNA polymerase elongation subunit (family B)